MRVGFQAVLARQYRIGTLLLWGVTILSVMLTYTLSSWLPTLLTARGFAAREAVLATVLLNLGAVIGGLAVGRVSDLFRPYVVLATAYALGAAALALIGVASGQSAVFGATFACAVLALGGQTGIGILATLFYDAGLRATGVGLALAFGRLGAVIGPMLVGLMLARGAGIPAVFRMGGAMGLLIALELAVMGYVTRRPHSGIAVSQASRVSP